MTETKHTLSWGAPGDDVNFVHDFLESIWVVHPDIPEMDRMLFETAIIELASNVIEHAESDDSGVACILQVQTGAHSLRAELSDTADAGSFRLATRGMPDDLAESGRGIALIQAMVDDLKYERTNGLNVWSISKKLATA